MKKTVIRECKWQNNHFMSLCSFTLPISLSFNDEFMSTRTEQKAHALKNE